MESDKLQNLGIKDLREKLNSSGKTSDKKKKKYYSSNSSSSDSESESRHRRRRSGLSRHDQSDDESADELASEKLRILSGIKQQKFFFFS